MRAFRMPRSVGVEIPIQRLPIRPTRSRLASAHRRAVETRRSRAAESGEIAFTGPASTSGRSRHSSKTHLELRPHPWMRCLAAAITVPAGGGSSKLPIKWRDTMTIKQRQTVSALLSLMFVVPASFKLFNVSIAVDHFTTWGIPFWMMHVIGASELAGAIGLLIPRTRLAAAYALFLLMIGGLLTHLTHAEYVFSLMPIAYGSGLYLLMKDSLPEVFASGEPTGV